MISIERLYSRQCPKSLNAEPTIKGAKPMTLDEILNILGQVQHKYPVGDLVLNAQIALDLKARKRLVDAMEQVMLQHDTVSDMMALAIAEAAVSEVTDTNRCPKCKGTGTSYSKRYNRLSECKRCSGTGKILKTHDQLYRSVMLMLPKYERMTQKEWQKAYYDFYMSAVDELHQAAGDAAGYAKYLLRKMEHYYDEVV